MDKKHIATGIIVLVALILIAIIISYNPIRNKPSDNTGIDIGFALSLTGRAGYLGERSNKAILLAIDDINKANPGRPLKAHIEDVQSDAKVAASAAHKLIDINQVDGIISEFGGPSNAVSPIALAAKKPFVYSSFVSDPVSKNEFAVKTFVDFEDPCASYGENAKSRGIKKIRIVDEVGSAHDCERGLLKNYSSDNISILSLAAVNGAKPDLRTELLKMKSDGIGGAILIDYEATSLAFFKEKKELGISLEVFCNRLDCATDKMIETLGIKSLEKARLFDTRISDKFVKEYSKRYGETKKSDLGTAAFMYDATVFLYEALSQCGDKEASCVIGHIKKSSSIGSAVGDYSFNGRILVPAIDYYQIKDGEIIAW